MESIVIGPAGHEPTDHIETNPTISLFKMFASSPGKVYPIGLKQDIAYQLPKGPPDDFGDFRDANVMLIRSKSTYKPFTIGLPHGVKVKPYGWEDDESYPFATWKGYDEPSIGYVSVIGHMLNYWHYRRTSDTIEQIYLHGMTNQENPQDDILELAWSWIAAPELQIPGEPLSPNGSAGKYNSFTYDQAQKAYIIPRRKSGPEKLTFTLDAIYDDWPDEAERFSGARRSRAQIVRSCGRSTIVAQLMMSEPFRQLVADRSIGQQADLFRRCAIRSLQMDWCGSVRPIRSVKAVKMQAYSRASTRKPASCFIST